MIERRRPNSERPQRAARGARRRKRAAVPVLPILHVDDDVLVIDKPPRMLSVPGRGGRPSAAELLRAAASGERDARAVRIEPAAALAALRGNPAVRIVHRLDVDASGVMLYARTLEAHRALVAQFHEHTVQKTYHAIVSGYVEHDGEVTLNLLIDRQARRVRTVTSGGKPACTRFRVLQRLAGHTLLECRPTTGRLHQIRVHLAAIGHSLAVDPVYGREEPLMLSRFKPDYRPSARREERPLIARLTLHAARIELSHPATSETIAFESAWPKDFRATVAQLGRLVQPPAAPPT